MKKKFIAINIGEGNFFKSKEKFIKYLENILIPDLKEFEDFLIADIEEALYWLKKGE